MVGLDAVHDCALVDAGVDAPGVVHARSLVEGQLLLPDLEDLRGVQAVEGAQAHEPVVSLGAERPALDAGAHLRLEGLDVGDHRGRSLLHGLVQAGLGALVQHAVAGGLDLGEQGRHVPAGLDLELLPEPDLGRRGASPVLIEERGHGLQPRGQRREPVVQRGEVAGEDGEESVPDRVHGSGAALPDAMDLHVEELAPDIVESQLALEADAVRQLVRVDRLQLALDLVCVGDLLRDGVAGRIVEAVVSVMQADVRGQNRVLLHHAPEVGFDDAPEAFVGGAGGRPGDWSRENELCHVKPLRVLDGDLASWLARPWPRRLRPATSRAGPRRRRPARARHRSRRRRSGSRLGSCCARTRPSGCRGRVVRP